VRVGGLWRIITWRDSFGRYVLVDSQVREELLDFPLAHFSRALLFIKQFNSVDVTLLFAVGIVVAVNDITHVIQQMSQSLL